MNNIVLRLKRYASVVVLFTFFLALYIYTAAPGIYDGDSGEMAAAINTLGLAHPTGFPLYMILGKLFTILLPIGDIAYRLNILSALLTAVSLIFIYYTLKNLGRSVCAALIASFVLGLGHNTIWSNAGTSRVYASSLLFVSILFFVYSQWKIKPKTEHLYLYGFLWGLSLGTHSLMFVMVVPFLFMIWQARTFLKKKIFILARVMILTILPGFQYIYLLFAYKRNGIITWGDMSSLDGFLYYITQKDFSDKFFTRSLQDSGAFIATLLNFFSSEFIIPFFLLTLLGLVVFYNKDRKFFLLITVLTTLNILIMFFYGNNKDLFILYRYVFIVYIALAIGLAYFLDSLFDEFAFRKNKVGLVASLVVILFLMGLQFKTSYASNNIRNNHVMIDFANNILKSVDSGSILFINGDIESGAIWYIQSVGQNRDIIVIVGNLIIRDWYIKNLESKYPEIISKGLIEKKSYDARIATILSSNIVSRKIYSTFTEWEGKMATGFEFIPIGVVHRVVSNGADTKDILSTSKQWGSYNLEGIKLGSYKNVYFEAIARQYLLSLNNTGMVYFRNGFLNDAEELLREALSINDSPAVKANLQAVLDEK